MQRIDRTGQKYGHLLIEEMIYGEGRTKCKCLCDCGKEIVKDVNDVIKKKRFPSNCGCEKVANKAIQGEEHRAESLVGQKYGHLTVVDMKYGYGNNKKTICVCKCDCGETCLKAPRDLKKAATPPNCGCMMEYYRKQYSLKRREDVTGQRFGRLTVLEMIFETGKNSRARCQCDCGNIVIVNTCAIKRGSTQSCGCYHKDRTSECSRKDNTGFISEYGVELIEPLYVNKQQAIVWKCKCRCGNIFEAIPELIKSGNTTSCGCNKTSLLEQWTASALKDLDLKYIREYSFDDCTNVFKLRFDFYLPDYNTLIECQGKQHYEPVSIFGGEDAFKDQVKRDEIKKEYCNDNNIQLIEIPYYFNKDRIKNELENTVLSLETAQVSVVTLTP